MISILMLSMDRYDLLVKTLTHNLAKIGPEKFELLICDNGSTDQRVIEYLKKQDCKYLRLNQVNEGVGKAFNQLYLRSEGEYILTTGNDILLPDNWGTHMSTWLEDVPNSGLAGIMWGHAGTPPCSRMFGLDAHWTKDDKCNRVFGATMFRRELVEQIGLFHEGFHEYGIEDSDLNERANVAGFNSFYIPGLHSDHIGVGESDTGEYRAKKNDSLSKNANMFGARCESFHSVGIKEPLPPLRGPYVG
jgi:GT2 family glycosyltransferase